MATGDRFYLMPMSNRMAVWGDIGNLLKIEGLVVGGGGAQAVLMLPDTVFAQPLNTLQTLTVEEWSEWLRLSDDPQVLVMPEKAFHRKLRYEISGAVQQKVWVADGLKCMYCQRPMGEVQLTVDHFVPLELGGENTTKNYVSACRKCNKDKGSMSSRDWCALKGLNYNEFVRHLACRAL